MNPLRGNNSGDNLSKEAIDEITKVISNMKNLHDIVIAHLNENRDGFVVAGKDLKVDKTFETYFNLMLKEVLKNSYNEVEHLIDRSDLELINKIKDCFK